MMRGRIGVLFIVPWLLFASEVTADEAEEALALARRTLQFVRQSADRPELARELGALEARLAGLAPDATGPREALAAEARGLRRRVILSHPLLGFRKLLVNKRPPPAYSHQSRQYLGRYSRTGPGLVVLDAWKDDPKETVLLEGKLPTGSVLHPDLSFDAQRVLFSFCDHTPQDPDLRQFFLYEVGIDGSGLRRLTGTDDDPLLGADGRQTALVEDFDPCYLPDGGFAFVSTRVQTHIRCQYGGRYFANFLLYRADADGSNIRPLSFGEAPEWEPSVLDDGRILYTRWDYINRHDTLFQSLWVTRPDGAATAHLYGNYTRNPCMTAEARAIPGSHKLVCTATAHHSHTAGSLIVVDPHQADEGETPITRITPEIVFPETEGWPEGAYATPYPLSEDLFLAAYTPDPLVREPNAQRQDAFAIYLVDTLGGRELIYRDPETSCFAPIPVVPRPRPPMLPSPEQADLKSSTGTFFVENVYQSTQEIPPGSVKRLRVVRLYGQPVQRPPSRGAVIFETPKRILGTVPVGEDGSVAFRAPAREPLLFQLLDENGMAVMSMRSFVYLQPGEAVGCAGCHEPRNTGPRNVVAGLCAEVRDLEPPAGPRYDGGLSFARTVQPVLDRYCITCHGLDETAGELNLLGTLQDVVYPYEGYPGPNHATVSLAYHSLLSRDGLVKIAQRNHETDFSTPKDYFSHAGRLTTMLREGHKDEQGGPQVQLDRESLQRIVDWLDLNAVFYGDYSWNKAEWRKTRPEGEEALRDHIRGTFGKELADQPYAALVNVALPSQSRILQSPLSRQAGGWGQLDSRGWATTADPGYQQMRRLVEASLRPPADRDVAGTCGRNEECQCESCWVRRAWRCETPASDSTGRTASY